MPATCGRRDASGFGNFSDNADGLNQFSTSLQRYSTRGDGFGFLGIERHMDDNRSVLGVKRNLPFQHLGLLGYGGCIQVAWGKSNGLVLAENAGLSQRDDGTLGFLPAEPMRFEG